MEDQPYEYVAWFRDESVTVDHDDLDDDHEWPGVICIIAPDAAAAQAWGDVLAATCQNTFLWSAAKPWEDPSTEGVVVARVGQRLSADEIGW